MDGKEVRSVSGVVGDAKDDPSVDNAITLPCEIIEKILLYCDCQTLLIARKVHPDWMAITDHCSMGTFKSACETEIPQAVLSMYLEKWLESDVIKWREIYESHNVWSRSQAFQFECEITAFNTDIELLDHSVTCMEAIGDYIAFGSENGRVYVYDTKRKRTVFTSLAPEIPKSIHLAKSSNDAVPSELLLFAAAELRIIDLHEKYEDCSIANVEAISCNQRQFCFVQNCTELTVAAIIDDHVHQRKSYKITCQIDMVGSLRVWAIRALFLCEHCCLIRGVDCYYQLELPTAIMSLKRIGMIPPERGEWIGEVLVMSDTVAISIVENDQNGEQTIRIDVGDLPRIKRSTKYDWPHYKVGRICCMLLFSNTFVVATTDCHVYFYLIDDWHDFDLDRYEAKIKLTICAHYIDTVATENERIFYFAEKVGSSKIYKLVTKMIIKT